MIPRRKKKPAKHVGLEFGPKYATGVAAMTYALIVLFICVCVAIVVMCSLVLASQDDDVNGRDE